MSIKVGVTLPQFTAEPQRFVEGARVAEASGYDSMWVFDHLWPLSGGRDRPDPGVVDLSCASRGRNRANCLRDVGDSLFLTQSRRARQDGGLCRRVRARPLDLRARQRRQVELG